MGGTDEGADVALEVDANARLVDGGREDLGGEAGLFFGRFADLVDIDRLEAEGGAEFVGLNGAGGAAGDEFKGDCPGGSAGCERAAEQTSERSWCLSD